MNLPKVTNNAALLLQIEQASLYQNLVNQLNKDFEIIGTAVDFSETTNPQDLFDFLQEVVTTLLEKHFDVFLNLLYRIDINEQQIKPIINTISDDAEQQIAFLILKREWQKVWFKKYYS